MHCQKGGEVWACFGLLNAFRRFLGGFEPFLGFVVHRSDRLRSPVWPVRVLALFTCAVDRSDRSELSWCSSSVFVKWFACIRPGGVALFQGERACVQGSSLWFSSFVLVVCALCLSIVLFGCVELLPLPKVSETCFFKWSFSLPCFGFWWLVGLSFYLFL
jgi:hypothetical protein